MPLNNIVWTEWVKYTEQLKFDASNMYKNQLKEKILESMGPMSDEQKKVFLKKLRWKNKKKLTDMWIEEEYHRIHPKGI